MENQIPGLNSQQESDLFNELKKILQKFRGAERKFGIFLDHKHFEIKKDEVMHEKNDPKGRILLIRPLKQDDISNTAYPTEWRLGDDGNYEVGKYCCD